ncbi:hypothetical protein OCGS_2501 [Oceaniovalibus guishaninsula JLT2003]|uniref:Lipoprotein n=1 Tax=Oceaniovalibus guishaninsula JLT2003 TaxID=1231392 RepID=K2H756_9RHOB|nr:DUF3833 family protein [Oceaniovalibus guishaninsula]EKE43463.1 hypothetical protein OCGS_2501 [Oceaniovalibus guishaninsula JLT2003]
MSVLLILTTFLALIVLAVLLRDRFLSFRGQDALDYTGLGPQFDPRVHLAGAMVCDGVIFGPTGRVASCFTGRITGRWDGDRGDLTMDFVYDSGARQSRNWKLTLLLDGSLTGLADDVKGQGQGAMAGPAMQLRYRIALPPDAGGHVLSAVDWMYLTRDGHIVNRSQFRKYGILVAELVGSIRPDAPSENDAPGEGDGQ